MNGAEPRGVYCGVRLRGATVVWLLLVCAGTAGAQPARPASAERLLILSTTGAERGGLPEVVAHPEPGAHLDALMRGYSGRLLGLYTMAQRFRHPDRPPQPAYLVLSDTQGGFPRKGFHFGQAQPDTY